MLKNVSLMSPKGKFQFDNFKIFLGQIDEYAFAGGHDSARNGRTGKNSKSMFAFIKIKSTCLCHIVSFKLPMFNDLIHHRNNAN